MATKKKAATKKIVRKSAANKTKKTVRAAHETIDTKTESLLNLPVRLVQNPSVMRFWKSPSFYIGLVAILVGAVLLMNKSWWIAASVNGKPIFTWDLNKSMTQRFGQQTLEGMISEELIADAAENANIEVTQEELDAKIQEITKGFGENVKLEDLLQFQGMTKEEFEKQLRLQITVEKLVGKDVSVTDEEVAAFIASNSATMTATDEASLKTEASEALRTEKVNEKMQAWFAELKEKASIQRYL